MKLEARLTQGLGGLPLLQLPGRWASIPGLPALTDAQSLDLSGASAWVSRHTVVEPASGVRESEKEPTRGCLAELGVCCQDPRAPRLRADISALRLVVGHIKRVGATRRNSCLPLLLLGHGDGPTSAWLVSPVFKPFGFDALKLGVDVRGEQAILTIPASGPSILSLLELAVWVGEAPGRRPAHWQASVFSYSVVALHTLRVDLGRWHAWGSVDNEEALEADEEAGDEETDSGDEVLQMLLASTSAKPAKPLSQRIARRRLGFDSG